MARMAGLMLAALGGLAWSSPWPSSGISPWRMSYPERYSRKPACGSVARDRRAAAKRRNQVRSKGRAR